MRTLGLERTVVDRVAYERAVGRLREAGVVLPTFGELAIPSRIAPAVRHALAEVDPDAPHPLNLFRVHWYNDASRRGSAPTPEHLVLPRALTGVDAPIVVALGDRFPMIRAHKVLAAYACLAPRIVTGQFDPTVHRAVWPSTGNYARGGVAISRIMGCRGIAVLPEGMSRERFAWLERWVADPADIIRTPGTESNVKEIYDKCAELEREPDTVIFNQFCEFGNHLAHYLCTGRALEHVFESLRNRSPDLRLAAFVSASGSAGTLGAGDYLKERCGARIVAVEALECPTMLYNGFGEHNIQGIGDKHIPLIHNVTNTDLVVAISDRSTDRLDVLFNTEVGQDYLITRRGVPAPLVGALGALGLSSICNVLAAIKIAKYYGLGPRDVLITVATDSAAMYGTEREKTLRRDFPSGFDLTAAGEVFGECLAGVATDHLLELGHRDRARIFNLGYYTWVEQQGVALEAFEARRSQAFWRDLRDLLAIWDAMIEEFNSRTAAAPAR
ncbi:MAG: pyridoxal-phosphate dependent enzyme [Armatimonadota bacterium]|nr:pyridoxal-phosphate dependent enzyme [Armatimonadota bacterium]MDR7453650.1 pyridoxal-phosphate dependent enzyme [Armatimonadota bacterium]MDR7497118.1 pyridoxal-phosphate dependent enzyme [Armatimonadota bacterium]MDR7511397.1 pyridoxal-phosphate dependent enzyme [Armatimonadota bacterium]